MCWKDENAGNRGEWRKVSLIAVAWFTRMRSSEQTPADERRFRAWLSEDERHAAAYASIERAWEKSGEAESLPGFQALRQEALQPPPGGMGRQLRGAGGRVGWGLAAAAAVVLILTVGSIGPGTLWPHSSTGRVYETTGERTTVTLADGSRVTLTSGSRLTTKFSDETRRLLLSKGEAYFDVAHDPARPFRVEAGRGTVTALGTEFDVYKKNGEVVVTLVEGRVEVASLGRPQTDDRALRKLTPGEQVSYDHSGLGSVREVDVAQAVSWRQGRIVVSDKPLLDVIDEMNRHSMRKLRVDRSDPRLKNLLVTGHFRTGRPELLVEYIRTAGIRVWETRDSDGSITLRLRGSI